MGVVLIFFIVASYRKRFFITFWLMKQRRKYKSFDKKDMGHLYDVFVSYSQSDHKWVTEELLPELEQKNPKLDVHSGYFLASSILHSGGQSDSFQNLDKLSQLP